MHHSKVNNSNRQYNFNFIIKIFLIIQNKIIINLLFRLFDEHVKNLMKKFTLIYNMSSYI